MTKTMLKFAAFMLLAGGLIVASVGCSTYLKDVEDVDAAKTIYEGVDYLHQQAVDGRVLDPIVTESVREAARLHFESLDALPESWEELAIREGWTPPEGFELPAEEPVEEEAEDAPAEPEVPEAPAEEGVDDAG